jgi:hypothetical protein
VSQPPSSSATKRAVVQVLLEQAEQTVKLVVDPAQLGPPQIHGFPDSVTSRYTTGIPLDLNPRWPLELDLESDPLAMGVSLSFQGAVTRCRVPWKAILILGVGFGGVSWEHEREDVPPPAPLPPKSTRRKKGDAAARASHLRLIK